MTKTDFWRKVVQLGSDVIVDYPPLLKRASGGGIGLATSISSTNYSHFARSALGQNNRAHTVYYHGTSHGQDDNEGVCTAQTGVAGIPLIMNGVFTSGGILTLAAPNRLSIVSEVDLSGIQFTFTGTINGVPDSVLVVNGPTAGGRIFTPGASRFTLVTSIVPSADIPGDLTVGLYATPSNVEHRYSDDGGLTWSDPYPLINGLVTQDIRGYQTAISIDRTGVITVYVYITDITTNISSTVVFFSYDNGITWTERVPVVFTGLQSPDTRVTLYSAWRRLGDGSMVSIGSTGSFNTYWLRSTDGVTINGTLMLSISHAIANTMSWQIVGINSGTKTLTLAPGLGDVTSFFPVNMSTTIADSGGANGNSYVTSCSYNGTNTLVVLNALSAGSIISTSRVRHTYGPSQIISANAGTNSVVVMHNQTGNFSPGRYMGCTGSSGAGSQRVDGLHKIATSVYNAGTNRTTITFVDTLPSDAGTVGPTTRTTSVVLGEWGFDCLTDATWAAVPRTNGMVSKVPVFTTNDAGTTWVMQGSTNAPEGSYVSMSLDFIDMGTETYTVIGAFRRSGIDKFCIFAARSSDLLVTQNRFTDLYYWLEAGGTTNSGYPSVIVMGSGNAPLITYGVETAVNLSNLQARRVDLSTLVNPVAFSAPALVSGRYYGNVIAGAATSQVLVENRLTFVLVPAPLKLTTISQIGAYVSLATGVTTSMQFRFGAYEDNGGKPDGGRLIIDAGLLNATGSAGLHVKAAVANVGPGSWWIAVIGNLNGGGGNMPSVRASATSGQMQAQIGWDGGNYNSFIRYLYADMTIPSWGSFVLPAVAPATLYADSGASTNTIHLLYQKG